MFPRNECGHVAYTLALTCDIITRARSQIMCPYQWQSARAAGACWITCENHVSLTLTCYHTFLRGNERDRIAPWQLGTAELTAQPILFVLI